jgi:hypothetical protein
MSGSKTFHGKIHGRNPPDKRALADEVALCLVAGGDVGGSSSPLLTLNRLTE